MRRVNVAILGASNVGKSTFSLHVRQGPHFDPEHKPPVTLQMEMETITRYDVVAACETVEVVLFDFQGAGPRAEHLLRMGAFARKANVVLFVYDVTRRETFEEIRLTWAPHVMQVCRENPVCILLGNKLDAVGPDKAKRAMTEREVKALGAAVNASHCFEISALNGAAADVKLPLDIALTEWLARPLPAVSPNNPLRLMDVEEGTTKGLGERCC